MAPYGSFERIDGRGALGGYLATGTVAPPPPDPTEQLGALYDHYLTAGFPSGTPVPGDA